MDLDQHLAVPGHGDLGRGHGEFVEAVLARLPLLHDGGHGGECARLEGAEVRLTAGLLNISAEVNLEYEREVGIVDIRLSRCRTWM